ncbi:MAG: hypothetical protein LC725_04815 [Lentisphaerae bacterium]|nr:hypothetical protein [Lentisphaerota bacterium]
MLGLITGLLFGFLLQKDRVLRFEKQVGAMLLKDKSTVLAWKDFGKIGLPEILGIPFWLVILDSFTANRH